LGTQTEAAGHRQSPEETMKQTREEAEDYVRRQVNGIVSKLNKTIETIEKHQMTEYQIDTHEFFHSLDFQLRYITRSLMAIYSYHWMEDYSTIQDLFQHPFLPAFARADILSQMRAHNKIFNEPILEMENGDV
tara:strand:- start:537 stop:935 length:399 start_codon:yes stop_codon:yes gene_type:complete